MQINSTGAVLKTAILTAFTKADFVSVPRLVCMSIGEQNCSKDYYIDLHSPTRQKRRERNICESIRTRIHTNKQTSIGI